MSEGCSWSGTATVKEHYIGEVEACDKGGDRATTRSREGHIKETTEDLYPNDQPYACNAGDGHPEPHDEEITQDFHPKDQSNEHGDTTIVQEDHDEATDKDIFQTSATEGNSGDEPGTRPSSLSPLPPAHTTTPARRWPSQLYAKDALATRTWKPSLMRAISTTRRKDPGCTVERKNDDASSGTTPTGSSTG